MVDQIEMSDAKVQIQSVVMRLILLVVIEIITKKESARMIVIKTGVTEIVIGMDTGHGIGTAMNVIV